MVWRQIKSFLRKLFGIKEKVQQKILTERDKLISAYEKERATLKAKNTLLEAENKKLRKIGEKKEDPYKIPRELNKQLKEIQKNQYSGSLSLKGLFEKSYKDKDSLNIFSYDMSKKFGVFEDIWILKDGRIAIISKDKKGGEKNPVIVGETFNDVFKSSPGLVNVASKGLLTINLNRDGKYVEDILQRQMPHIILDAHGQPAASREKLEPYAEILADRDEKIGELTQQIKELESTLSGEMRARRDLKLQVQFEKQRADSMQADFKDSLVKTSEMTKVHYEMSRENTLNANMASLSEQILEQLEDKLGMVFQRYGQVMSEDKRQQFHAELRDTTDWFVKNMLKLRLPRGKDESERIEASILPAPSLPSSGVQL